MLFNFNIKSYFIIRLCKIIIVITNTINNTFYFFCSHILLITFLSLCSGIFVEFVWKLQFLHNNHAFINFMPSFYDPA